MSGDTKAPGTEGAPPAAKAPGPPKIVLILLVLNLGATGFLTFKNVTAAPHAVAGKKSDAHDVKSGKPKPGPMVTMDPFVVNLNEPTSSRFLKAAFELEVADAATVKALEDEKRAVRDEVLRYLSGLTVEQTLGEENKTKIQESLIARIDKRLGGGGKVRRMYFSEFMVQ